ncbi:MAG TPA: MBL fold metallo-hydrolase [Bryobacteraceae bacterium]|nr:MBL fold metallo-hydrolase [Bryobacteraceae bacterium]
MASRRLVISGLGAGAALGAAGFAYNAAPSFWRQYMNDLRRGVAPAARSPQWRNWSNHGVCAAWLGHSTVLLRINGYTIVTDPMFSTRAGIDLGIMTLGVKRLIEPALTLKNLPKIDLILNSHAHMDHLDTPSMAALESKQTEVIMAHATSDIIRAGRYSRVRELRWGESVQAGPLRITAIEVNHWGARLRSDTYRGYNGYIIESNGDGPTRRVLFAGDTANTDLFRGLKSSRPFDLALMPIGAYNPWIRAHCTPEQSWRMANEAGAERFLPMHHQTFPLGREPFREPIERLFHAAGNGAERIVLQRVGEEVRVG